MNHELNYSLKELNKKLSKETITVELISKDFIGYKNLKENDKKALEHLVNAAKILNGVALEQDHPLNIDIKRELEKNAKKDEQAKLSLRLFNSLNGVVGTNGINKKPIAIVKGISALKGHNFYPADLSIKEFHSILIDMLNIGKIAEVKKILSARTMVRRLGKGLTSIDYTKYFAVAFKKIALELQQASKLVTNKDFKKYLELQADALLKEDENLDAKADKAWASLQDTDLEFTLGRENYDDGITVTVFDNPKLKSLLEYHNIEAVAKDMLGIRVGIVNKKGTELILKFKKHMCKLAALMPFADKYKQSVSCHEDTKQSMVDVDLVYVSGDYAQVRGGMTTAQNLPNNDKLSVKDGNGRRNVYHRQVRASGDKAKTQKLLDLLVDENLHQYYNREADHLFVIGHENGHSFGPDSSFQNAVGIYHHVIEELKADIISLAFMGEYAKAKIITEQELKEVYLTVTVRGFLAAKPQMATPHRIAELIIFNYLLDHKALRFKDKLTLDFNAFGKVCYNLLAETIKVQLSKSPFEAKKFIDKYAMWSKTSQKIADVHKKLGLKPYKEIKSYF